MQHFPQPTDDLARLCENCSRRYPAAARYCAHDGQALVTHAPADGLPWAPTAAASLDAFGAAAGQSLGHLILGRYLRVRKLGAGGQGDVWLAQDIQTNRMLALKYFQDDMVDRCRAELMAAARIEDHTHVVKLFDHHRDPDGGGSFLTMEYLDGETLEDLLARSPRLSRTEAVRLLEQIARGLAEMHDKGLVHRDVKPANIMLLTRPDGLHAKLLDLGIAKSIGGQGHALTHALTMAGGVVGTLGYAAPEQLRGEPVTSGFDMYGLGVVAHELLHGAHPLDSTPPAAHRPSIPLPLRQLLSSMLDEDPAMRPADMAAVLEALHAFRYGADRLPGMMGTTTDERDGWALREDPVAPWHAGHPLPGVRAPRSASSFLPGVFAAAAAVFTLLVPAAGDLPLPQWPQTGAPSGATAAGTEVALAAPHWGPDVCTPGIAGFDAAC